MSIDIGGALCKCGNTGCLELYASRIALLRAVRERATKRLPKEATFTDVVDAYTDNDPIAKEEVNKVACYLAQGITNCINFANPDLIVIGDEYVRFGESFLNVIKSQVEKALLPSVYRSITIELSALTEDTVLKGAFLDVFAQTYLGATRDTQERTTIDAIRKEGEIR
jgi:predicted NBD/HSP70 family sugar kinase